MGKYLVKHGKTMYFKTCGAFGLKTSGYVCISCFAQARFAWCTPRHVSTGPSATLCSYKFWYKMSSTCHQNVISMRVMCDVLSFGMAAPGAQVQVRRPGGVLEQLALHMFARSGTKGSWFVVKTFNNSTVQGDSYKRWMPCRVQKLHEDREYDLWCGWDVLTCLIRMRWNFAHKLLGVT